jgi:uncharacterized protein YecE (DUF72 family)
MSGGIECEERFRIGTSGWVYPHWRGVFYPPGLPQSHWYSHYAKIFDTVEVNYSFYRLPSEEAFDCWREQAPPGFIYAVKANRYITHVKRLKDAAEPLARFLARARRLGEKLGPILWQLHSAPSCGNCRPAGAPTRSGWRTSPPFCRPT